MEPQAPSAAAVVHYWEERARRFGGRGAGLAAVCSFGMPLFYNRAIDWCQRLALRRWLRVRPGTRVLDVGCGVGRWSLRLAQRGAAVTGVDHSATMIAAARRHARTRRLSEQCRFEVRHLGALDGADKYDLVLSVTVLQHILDPGALQAAVQRMAQHLDRDGRLVVLEAAPARRSGRCDTAIFRARARSSYLQLFEECGLELRAMTGVDPAPFRTWLLPHLRAMPRGLRLMALAAVTAASLPVDVLFGRALLARSWHTVFVLSHRGCPRAY